MATITFIRHTRVDVPRGVCYGRTDVPVVATFGQEADAVRRQLEPLRFDEVFVSPLSRAVRLATYCGYPQAKRDPRLLELNFGEWEMQSYDTLYHSDPRFPYWCEHYCETPTPGGESVCDQARRLSSFLTELCARPDGEEDKHYAAFCHGGILAIAIANSKRLPLREAFREVPTYGSVVTLPLTKELAQPVL